MIYIDMYLIAADFEAARTAVYPNEISGFGFVEIKNTSEGGLRFIVYDWVLLDVGTFDYTVITPDQVQSLREHPNYKDLRIWLHSHPMGNGSPGAHNWSPMDERTIQKTPLGGPPELVKWSLSAVRTPSGWVGRMDSYKNPKFTEHIPVIPDLWTPTQKARIMREERRYAHSSYETLRAVPSGQPDSDSDRPRRSWFGSIWDRWAHGGKPETD